jgi:histidine triad (HIT) family protein
MASIFTRIVNGEIPSYKIAEDERFFAFLDIAPLAKGHTLVIPKQEIDYLFDLDDETYIGLQAFAKKIAVALKEAIPCVKIGVAVIGLEVRHAHVHLVPMQNEQDINFANPKKKFEPEEFLQIQQAILKQI